MIPSRMVRAISVTYASDSWGSAFIESVALLEGSGGNVFEPHTALRPVEEDKVRYTYLGGSRLSLQGRNTLI